ncbi:MAG: hypothetical protein PHU61_03200 [Candidatus Absconditabacteria bacterium]|nr:hypothetical protein [Candidatus Absconditabacteria bacterium]MDD3868212.1 hypothetical protein [Candidatus Absconditabacteria bacterium]MDD4714661.1 hypothetical protein [Candidatus Absconditabacteria bacterium]
MANELEKGVEKVSQEVSKAVEDVKDTAKEVGGRWKNASLEEKIATVIGIILLAWGFIKLWKFIWGIVLVTLGILLVTGYFNGAIKAVIDYFKGPKTKKATPVKKEEVKEEKKTAVKKTAKKK